MTHETPLRVDLDQLGLVLGRCSFFGEGGVVMQPQTPAEKYWFDMAQAEGRAKQDVIAAAAKARKMLGLGLITLAGAELDHVINGCVTRPVHPALELIPIEGHMT